VLARDTPAGIARAAATQELASFVSQLRGGSVNESTTRPKIVFQRESARHWLSTELQAASRLRQAHRLAVAHPRQLSLCLAQIQEADASFAQAWRQAGRGSNNNSSQSTRRPSSRGRGDDNDDDEYASGSRPSSASEQAAALAVTRRALWWDELLGLFALLTFGSATKRVGEAEVHYLLQDTSLVALREIGRLHFKSDDDASSREALDSGRRSWAAQAADGFTADVFVTFADELLARAGARAAASSNTTTTGSTATNTTENNENTSDNSREFIIGGPEDRGPFAGVLTDTGTGADVLRAHNNNDASASMAASLNPLYPTPVPQMSSLLSAESRARLLLLRSHRQRTLRDLKQAQKRDLKALEEGSTVAVSVDGFWAGELLDSEEEDDDEESGGSLSDNDSIGRGSNERLTFEDADDFAQGNDSNAEGAFAEEVNDFEEAKARVTIDASAIPAASETGGGSFDFFLRIIYLPVKLSISMKRYIFPRILLLAASWGPYQRN